MYGLQALSANRGGVVVEVEGLRGFVPFSQISAVSFLVPSPSSMGFLSDYHDFTLTRSWLLPWTIQKPGGNGGMLVEPSR
jgi:hypothetical protein